MDSPATWTMQRLNFFSPVYSLGRRRWWSRLSGTAISLHDSMICPAIIKASNDGMCAHNFVPSSNLRILIWYFAGCPSRIYTSMHGHRVSFNHEERRPHCALYVDMLQHRWQPDVGVLACHHLLVLVAMRPTGPSSIPIWCKHGITSASDACMTCSTILIDYLIHLHCIRWLIEKHFYV